MDKTPEKVAFGVARKHVIPFGKFKGQEIDKIAETDAGLKYLDWLNGQAWVNGPLKNCLVAYLTDPTIKKELDAIT